MKTQYRYGDCIPISDLVYKRLKQKGYNPKIVVGWVEIYDGIDILPDEQFVKLFKNWMALTLPHTWVECKGHRIDLTKNQFDIYGGIYQYYPAYIDIPGKNNIDHKLIKYKKGDK